MGHSIKINSRRREAMVEPSETIASRRRLEQRVATAGERPPHKEAQAYGCCVSTLTRFARPPLQRPLTHGRDRCYADPSLYALKAESSKVPDLGRYGCHDATESDDFPYRPVELTLRQMQTER